MIHYSNLETVNYIKMMIKNAGYTIEEVADKMGISGQNLHRILNKKNLSFNDINRICKAMNYVFYYEMMPLNNYLERVGDVMAIKDTD